MLTVKCPHCATALKLRQAPPSGKVKCPKCSNAVAIRAPATKPAATRKATVPAGRKLDPDDEGFDFGQINAPTASPASSVSHFPVNGNLSAYNGPIPGDPLLAAGEPEEGAEAGETTPAPAPTPAKKKNPAVLVGALAVVGVLMIGGVAAVAMMGGGGGGDSGPSSAEMLAAAQSTAPSGYQAVGIEGCIVLMPKGASWDKLPSMIESVAVTSPESESVYFMGAMNGGKRPLDKEQMRKKAGRQLGGEILVGGEITRNGYKGISGMLDGSIFLPRMEVEIFHVDERFAIIGVARASLGSASGAPVNRQAEEAEMKIFHGSFKVGPKPSGWLW